MISFSSLYELFQAFFCANNSEGLVKSLFGVKIFNHSPSFPLSSSPSRDGMGDKSSLDFSLYQSLQSYPSSFNLSGSRL